MNFPIKVRILSGYHYDKEVWCLGFFQDTKTWGGYCEYYPISLIQYPDGCLESRKIQDFRIIVEEPKK